MPHLISNLYEKNYTPYTAKLAPRNLWNRPVLGKSHHIYHLTSFYFNRKKATKADKIRGRSNRQSFLEIH